MKRATFIVAFALLASFAVCHAAKEQQDANTATVETANKKMDPTAFQPGNTLTYNPLEKKIRANRVFDTRVTGAAAAAPAGQVTVDGAGNVVTARQTVTANYPDPILTNPNGWRVGAKSTSTMNVVTPTTEDVHLANTAQAATKLAPAIALAGTSVLSSAGTTAITTADAVARPGLQYGVTLGKAEQQMVNLNTDFWAGKSNTNLGAVRARAVAGQGQTVALGKNVMRQNIGTALGDVRINANSARWYLSPGHAISLAANVANAARVEQFTQMRARAEQGTATGGILAFGTTNGNMPFQGRGLNPNQIYSETDGRVNADAGAAQAGFINIQRGLGGGRVALRNFPGATAATAVGNAAAGGISIGFSENGKVIIGDYDQENDSPENDVAATTRGRGTAEAGQVSLAVAPNDSATILGDVRATANQGAAAAGAFTMANAYETAEQGIDVNARTSEYDAVAGNVGVSIAAERSVGANSATARTTTGSALAFNEMAAVVSKQNSATASSDATTTTGQAAAFAAAQGVGGVHADSQGAASATTSTGNALSIGTGISGAMYTTRAVSTSAAASKDGQAVSASLSGAVSADSTADTAASAATTAGNAASAAQGYSLGIFQGKSTVASSAGTEEGSAGSLALGVSTGIVQAQSRVASSAETKDGRAQSLAGSLAAAGINSISSATSSGASETGDVTSNAQSFGLGVFHGEAAATSSSSTGCVDCVSDSVANAIATGVVADSLARSAADSDKNPGNALANAISVGFISRTSNGGSSRIAVGPAQAISGGFAVSAGKKVQNKVAAAVNPAAKKDAVSKATAEQKA